MNLFVMGHYYLYKKTKQKHASKVQYGAGVCALLSAFVVAEVVYVLSSLLSKIQERVLVVNT